MTMTRRAALASGALAAAALPASAQVTRLKSGAKTDQSKALQRAIDEALEGEGVLRLPVGSFMANGLKLSGNLRIEGVPGRTRLISTDGSPIIAIEGAGSAGLSGIAFDGNGKASLSVIPNAGLVTVENAADVTIESCAFENSGGIGLSLKKCTGRVANNQFTDIAETALFSIDGTNLLIYGNRLRRIGNNGIQVWSSEKRVDGSLVTGNFVDEVEARNGGSGQNGNGINIYRSGNVIVSGNRLTRCAFSGIRNNSGSNCQIIDNSVSQTGEVAIYVEFAFEGAVVSGNMIEDVAFGISITNLDQGGRLAVCAGNVVRNCKGGSTEGVKTAGGIYAEADTAVSGNVVENARDVGIALGWGKYSRDLSATGNVVRDCGKAITASLSEGAQSVLIANNIISGSRMAAIMGMDHADSVTGDLAKPGAEIPDRIMLAGNLVR